MHGRGRVDECGPRVDAGRVNPLGGILIIIVSHNTCGLCVPSRQCLVLSLTLRLNWESELQDVSGLLTVGMIDEIPLFKGAPQLL